jgi:hypothetical protein
VSELNEWEAQLSDLLKIAAGQPQRQVTTAMVRRRVIRRRVVAGAAAAGIAVLLGGIGAAVAATTNGFEPASGGRPTPGVPSYYIEQGSGRQLPVVRSRHTGAVTATVRCPRHGQHTSLASIAPASQRTFFLVCEQQQTQAATAPVTASLIYRFRLTTGGRIMGYAPVHGGSLQGLRVAGIAATADGSELAVTAAPGSAAHGRPDDVLVINTRSGGHKRWLASSGKPGTIKYGVGDMSLTADGRELAFLTQPRCVPPAGAPKCHVSGGQQVRALNLTARGGLVNHSRLLVKQASLMRIAIGYINAAVISPDGSRVTVAEVGWPDGYVSIVRASATTGKQVSVVYRQHTGEGFSYRTFAADPSVRYFLLAAGPPRGAIPNGWIAHGKLHRLRPFDGSNVGWEIW